MLFYVHASTGINLRTYVHTYVRTYVRMLIGFWSPKELLVNCDHIVDKAFCMAVLAAAKWLQQDLFPHGIYEPWPPSAPADFNTAGFQPT